MKKALLIFGGLIGLGTIGLVLYKKGVFSKKEIGAGTNTNSNTNSNTATANTRNDNFPLKKGSYGERVKTLQTTLNKFIKNWNKLGKSEFTYNNKKQTSIGVDKDWGSETEAAMSWATGQNTVGSETALNNLVVMANSL